MKRNHVLGVLFLAVFAFGVLTASASAVTFLLALWLFNNVAVSSILLVESSGELELVNKDGGGLGVTAKALCSGIFDGWVGPESLDELSELLNLSKELISNTELSGGLTIECSNSGNCEKAKAIAENLPWETEAELMVDGTEEFFVDLIFNAAYYVECTILGTVIGELCEVANTAVELKNEGTGVDATFSDAFQGLAGGKLANCSGGGVESGEVNGLGTIADPETGTLAVSE